MKLPDWLPFGKTSSVQPSAPKAPASAPADATPAGPASWLPSGGTPKAASDGFSAAEGRANNAMPASELSKPPLFRHIDYFDANRDGTVTVPEMYQGLRQLGVPPIQAFATAFGTGLVRGSQTEGKPSLDINIANAMASAQAGRSGVFGLDGNTSPQQVDDFLNRVDPQNTGHVTMADFDAEGTRIANDTVKDGGLVGTAKKKLMEGEFHLAWNTLMQTSGQKDDKGTAYLTRDQVRWFFDGSLFYRQAAARAAETPS